jgi:hypothetical protein
MMMSEIVTLTGAPLRRGEPTRPTLRLCGDPAATETRERLTPLNDCLLRLEAEMRRLHSLLAGDRDEWMDNLETLSRKVLGHD